MPTIKLKDQTMKRINEVFDGLFVGNSDAAKSLSKHATWDFKINAILDRLARGG